MFIDQLRKNCFVFLLVALVAACSSTTTDETESTTDSSTQSAENTSAINPLVDRTTPTESPDEIRARRNAEMRAERVVYFELDDSTVKAEFQDTLRAHAEFLSLNSHIQVTVEGHCDERGTPEYNLALGERRGRAVESILISYGVSSSQIRIVSFGEEKPAVFGHDESAWSKNRRAVIKYEG